MTGRPPKGELVPRRNGYGARLTVTIDGEKIRKRVALGTNNKVAARRKIERLVAEGLPLADAQACETFRDAAERVNAQRATDGVSSARDELARLKSYAFGVVVDQCGVFGDVAVSAVEARHVNAALDFAKSAGKAKQTVVHVRAAIRTVFEALKREGAVKVNPCDDATMPRFTKVATKETAILEDAELLAYLGYQHPDARFQVAVRQRQTMSCVSRCFGGLRTGDLHKLDWKSFQIGGGEFARGWAPRSKTKQPQLLVVADVLRPILRDWWERQGQPLTGPVFPALRGKRAGEAKGKVSHALALRRDLRRAFGVETWDAERRRYVVARDLTPREVELFEATDHTDPVDFHSWRRAFTQGLASAGVNVQMSAALAGHASLSAHGRYLANSGKAQSTPEAALPAIKATSWPKVDDRAPATIEVSPVVSAPSEWAGQDLNLRHPACKASPETPEELVLSRIAVSATEPNEPETPSESAPGLNHWPKLTPESSTMVDAVGGARHEAVSRPQSQDPLLESLERAAHAAVQARDWNMIQALGQLIDRRVQEIGGASATVDPRRNEKGGDR